MANSDFNLEMDTYLRKVKKKRTDPVDYSSGRAKISSSDINNINNASDDEIVVEEKQEGGFLKFFIKLFHRNRATNLMELEEEYEADVPIEEVPQLVEEVNEEFDEGFVDNNSKSLFEALFGWMRRKNLVDDFEDEQLEKDIIEKNSEVLKDVKVVFKSVNHWLNQLEPRKKKDFKNSEDFITYTEFLKKYRLIKE
jgi:hypothetical protein